MKTIHIYIAGSSLEVSEKKVDESWYKKNNSQQAEKRNIVCSDNYHQSSHRPQRYKFPQRLYEADEEEQRWLSYNIQMKLWEKANIDSFQHHNNCGSTHPSMAVSRENKLPPSFLDFKSQRVLYESSHDGVSRIENDEQPLNRSASVSHLWLLKAFFWFQNGSMILKTLTFADYCKQSYL